MGINETGFKEASSVQVALGSAQLRRMVEAADAEPLTPTEHAVLGLLAHGRSNAQIGQCLARSEKTVRNWLTRIYTKLGVANRAEAVAVHIRMEFDRGR